MRHMRLGCDGVGVYATGPVPAGRRNALTHQFARAGHARDVPRPIVHDGTCATAHAIGRGRATAAVPPGATAALAAVRQDLAQRHKLAEAQITVVRAAAVDWSDSSLGCPQPGMVYLQVVTPGYRLVLAAGAVSTEYHTDAGGRFVVCP